METLQQHKEDFSSLLQHMADCYKALLGNNTSCMSVSVAIIYLYTYPANEFKNIHAIRKNINTVDILMHDVLLHHFRKGSE